MLNKSKIVTFLGTSDPDSAKNFYEQILGLKLVQDDVFAIVFDANGIMLRVQKVQEHTPPKYTALGWDVTDIRAVIKDLMERGVEGVRYERLEQDELGIWTAPSGAKIFWFKDPDGNTLSLTEFQ